MLRNMNFAAIAVMTGMLGICAQAQADVTVPQYHFVVGQELDYTGRSTAERQDRPQMDVTDTTLKIWVVRENPDHSFHLIVMSTTKNGGAAAPGAKADTGEVTISPLDLTADGNTPDNSANTSQTVPEVLPPLPHDAATLAGWENADDNAGERTVFKPLRQRDSSEFLFQGTQVNISDPIYQTFSSATFHYDLSKGLITHVETQFSQGFGVSVRGAGKVDLHQVATPDGGFMKQLAAESDIYFAATAAAAKDAAIAATDPAQTEAKLADATAVLKDAQGKITLPMFKDQLDMQVQAQPDTAKFARDAAKHRAELLAAPPLDWSTTDLSGQPFAAASLRGKVVIMTFWSRGIPWCIAQLPAVKALDADFKNDAVAAVGMNSGDDPKDAQFVIQQMDLPYPQLKGDALANQWKINELPTVLVIDQAGKIREIYTGFSPTLHDDVSKTVKDLLGKK